MTARKNSDSLKLYNLVIPFVFWEIWHVLLALLVVAALESAVLSLSLGIRRFRFFSASFGMNLVTTLFGYILQGIARIIPLLFLSNYFPDDLNDSPLFEGIMGNVGIGFTFPSETFVAHFATSLILALLISWSVEYFVLRTIIKVQVRQRKLLWSVFLANLVSYALILAWLLFNFFIFYIDTLQSP
ncbi:MAG: hypothetical protein HC838_09480 [Spirulinaceae cyanobacterium RM2_2_10]|nr:hypothetical protein [Spirulinaceae cyanobacterium SM2_1_0]NJO20226.1 hypothetical protein [Spirulinaceae cyanobacterium RM2_2_10]